MHWNGLRYSLPALNRSLPVAFPTQHTNFYRRHAIMKTQIKCPDSSQLEIGGKGRWTMGDPPRSRLTALRSNQYRIVCGCPEPKEFVGRKHVLVFAKWFVYYFCCWCFCSAYDYISLDCFFLVSSHGDDSDNEASSYSNRKRRRMSDKQWPTWPTGESTNKKSQAQWNHLKKFTFGLSPKPSETMASVFSANGWDAVLSLRRRWIPFTVFQRPSLTLIHCRA